MDRIERFRRAAAEWAAGGEGAPAAALTTRELLDGLHTVVLVEGISDLAALDALAARHGRTLNAEGIAVVSIGGATSIGRFLDMFGPHGLGARLAGLCDAGEERFFRRGLERVGLGAELTRAEMEELGFYVCVADLEDELMRALGTSSVERIIAAEGDLPAFRTFQQQPAQRGRTIEQQLQRFMGTLSGRKSRYARALVNHLDLSRTPVPLERLLANL